MRHFFLLVCSIFAGCSPDVPQNPDFDNAAITVYRAGRPHSLPASAREAANRHLQTWWKNTSGTIGMPDYATYAPDVTIRTPKLNINMQKHRTIIGVRDDRSRAWLQYSRASNSDDEALRSMLQACGEGKEAQQNTRKNSH